MLTDPERLTDKQRSLRDDLTPACPEMIDLNDLIRGLTDLLHPQGKRRTSQPVDCRGPRSRSATAARIHPWPGPRPGCVRAALTLPYNNGGTEGVNTKTKLLKRQMYGRAGFSLLRHRILLG